VSSRRGPPPVIPLPDVLLLLLPGGGCDQDDRMGEGGHRVRGRALQGALERLLRLLMVELKGKVSVDDVAAVLEPEDCSWVASSLPGV